MEKLGVYTLIEERNLLHEPSGRGTHRCDVCILGAGAAGIYLATRLAALGQSVTLLEPGGRVCSDAATVGIEPVFTGDSYPGATVGRAFGLGGSTSRWGGLLAPHSYRDLGETPPGSFDPWHSIVTTVERRTNAVLAHLRFGYVGDFEELAKRKINKAYGALAASELDTVSALFLPLTSRNLVFLLRGRERTLRQIKIILNAVPTTWEVAGASKGDARIDTIGAVAANGNEVIVSATQVVIAAGAIESARILLEIQRLNGDAVVSKRAEVGNNLSDHLSCTIAGVKPENYDRAAGIFGPRFVRGCMRSFRFVERRRAPEAPRCFAHFIFEVDNPGFSMAKEVLASVQAHRRPNLRGLQIAAGAVGLCSFAIFRYVRSSLFIPKGTPVHLQLDLEQAPVATNSIRLGDEVDRFGRPVEKINWQVSGKDTANIERAAARILKKWPGEKGEIFDLLPKFGVGHGPKPHDAYHPVGTCRLGIDPGAVVSPQLRVHGTKNLWVLSTAVLPSAGTANPTFTMLCLGEELAETLARP